MEKKGEAKKLFLSLFIAMILCVGLISISYAASFANEFDKSSEVILK